jgi:hypothetical protein
MVRISILNEYFVNEILTILQRYKNLGNQYFKIGTVIALLVK